MRNFVQAYQDALGSGFISEKSIVQHIDQQTIIDQYLPESASFFYVVEIPANQYRFMGKQQVNVSGYTNDEFLEKGIELFLQSVHPDDVGIILEGIYPTMVQEVTKLPIEDRTKVQIQYNYRFRRKSGEYIDLMEQVYILELDENGMAALLLGNVIILDRNEELPIKLTIKLINDAGFSESIYTNTFRSVQDQLDGITKREVDILRNLATGKTSQEIGEVLFISRHTVDTHRRNLLKKLGCKSVVDLTRVAFRNGLL